MLRIPFYILQIFFILSILLILFSFNQPHSAFPRDFLILCLLILRFSESSSNKSIVLLSGSLSTSLSESLSESLSVFNPGKFVDELLDIPFALKHLIECDYHSLFEGVIERCKESHVKNSYNLFSKWMGLDLPDELLMPTQEAKPELIESCKEVLDGWNIRKGDFILAQLRASSPIRTPNHKFWVDLFNKLIDKGYNIILTDNPRQTESVDDFIKLIDKKDKIFNFCQYSKSLDYSIALTSLAQMTLCTDSAFTHIAVSLGVKAFAIFGPFPGYVRLKTYPNVDWVDAERSCAPCFIHGQEPCPQAGTDGYSPCYDELDQDEIVEKIEKLLK